MNEPLPPDDEALHALARTLGAELRDGGQVLATAESCTGGWIAKLVTDIPGSSEWFWGTAVTYSNAAKQRMLGVTLATLERYGAVSRECALEMVEGVLAHSDASVALAVTGIAGPDGGTRDKPVGTVYIAWQRRAAAARADVFHFEGDRDAVRRRSVAAALRGIQAIPT